jgi:hypothetical protein
MAKIKINKLPEGFEIKGGKVVKKMQQGGGTGDQLDYGLRTSPYASAEGQFNEANKSDVRYSLSSVPRDMANIEAEGGETALTDLNGSGRFGLYNIKGPRHTSGGVPMYLPEQSFIFSDTKAMKFNKNEMAEYGIESKKRLTPAQISKKYKINEYIGALDSEDIDHIGLKSAELMLDKNYKALSKLAFGQELKKDFSDGVPATAHPYLMSKGIDPMEFTQKVENITREQAAQRMLQSLPPEEQAKMAALQQMIAQAGQQQQMPMAKYGSELPKAQYGNNGLFGTTLNRTTPNSYGLGFQTSGFQTSLPTLPTYTNNDWDGDGIPNNIDSEPFGVRVAQYVADNTEEKKPDNSKSKRNIAFDPAVGEFYRPYGINVDASGIGESKYVDLQGEQDNGLYGDAASNLEGFKTAWKDIYPDIDALVKSLPNYKKGAKNPEVEKFQRWMNATYIPEEVNRIKEKAIAVGKTFSDADVKSLTERLTKDYGFKKGTGTDYDSLMGTWTSSRRPLTYNPKKEHEPELDKFVPLETVPLEKTRNPDFNFYQQDMVRGAAMAMRDRSLFLPWQPQVDRTKLDYVLEEPTRMLADNNEQFNIAAQALGAFAGPQALNARLAGAQGNAFKNSANIFSDVHRRNINTVNQGLAMNAQFAAADKQEEAKRNVQQYDDTQTTLQNYENDKNFDREQMADWYSGALDNAVKAYNLNSLYRFKIDPTTGGTIDLANAKMITPTKGMSAEDQRQQRLQNIDAIYNRYGKDVDAIKGAEYLESGQVTPDANPYKNQYGNPYGIDPEIVMAQRASQAKKGKEIKKYAVPFYTGKVGF